MKGIRATSTETFRKLFGNGLQYEIPKFQRDYSWTSEQWDDLWQDIQSILNKTESEHYLGYLVLQTEDAKVYKIIDGQQRLSTLSILILASLKVIQDLEVAGQDKERNERRRAQLLNSYIGYLDPVTLISSNKLKLNRHNDRFYKQFLVPLIEAPKRGLNTSEKLMKSCFEWFYTRIKKEFQTGEQIAQFVDTIVDTLYFTVITVGDELNAYKVFETLNARGVQLSTADLLKNYLFAVVDGADPHQTELLELEEHWDVLSEKLKSDKIPDFLRYYWNSYHKSTRKNDLFKAIRSEIKNTQQVFQLLRALLANVDIYIALQNPEDELWIERPEVRNSLQILKLFRAKQPFSLLLAAYPTLSNKQFEQLLRHLVVVYLRYNIISSLNPNEQDVVFNAIALKIRNGEKYKAVDIKPIYPSDTEFEVAFANKDFKYTSHNMRIVKYILSQIENVVYESNIDFESFDLTIEHILPRNPNDTWSNITEDEQERSKNRLGNMTLLTKSQNKRLGNEDFGTKFGLLAASNFNITREIPDNFDTNWNEEQIVRRQKMLAKKAKTVWKISM